MINFINTLLFFSLWPIPMTVECMGLIKLQNNASYSTECPSVGLARGWMMYNSNNDLKKLWDGGVGWSMDIFLTNTGIGIHFSRELWFGDNSQTAYFQEFFFCSLLT